MRDKYVHVILVKLMCSVGFHRETSSSYLTDTAVSRDTLINTGFDFKNIYSIGRPLPRPVRIPDGSKLNAARAFSL